MAYEQKELSGSLFKNDKGDNPSRPDYRGDCKIGGEVYEIAAWIKDGKNGKFISLSFKPKQERTGAAQSGGGETAPSRAELNDEIPFISRWGDR